MAELERPVVEELPLAPMAKNAEVQGLGPVPKLGLRPVVQELGPVLVMGSPYVVFSWPVPAVKNPAVHEWHELGPVLEMGSRRPRIR